MYKVTVGRCPIYFATLERAKEWAEVYFRKTGVVLGIEFAKKKSPK